MTNGTADYFDPRIIELDHEIMEGQVYGDSRHTPKDDPEEVESWPNHALFRLVYVDENTVVMKSNDWSERSKRRVYRQEPRDVFEEEAGAGRYKLLEDVSGAPRMPDDLTEVRALAMRWRDHYKEQGGRVNKHKAEAMEQFVEELQKLEPKEIDLTSVSGVGEGTAENLREAGYYTDAAILNAEKSDLTDVPGVGDAVAERLIEKSQKA